MKSYDKSWDLLYLSNEGLRLTEVVFFVSLRKHR